MQVTHHDTLCINIMAIYETNVHQKTEYTTVSTHILAFINLNVSVVDYDQISHQVSVRVRRFLS